MPKLTDRAELLALADTDKLYIVDASDPTDSPEGTSKYFLASTLKSFLSASFDRTQDVIIETTIVSNTTVETPLWSGSLTDLSPGELIKVHTTGRISNATAVDDITLRVYIGSTVVATFSPSIGVVSNVSWSSDVEIVIRSVGVGGEIALHGHIQIGDTATLLNSIIPIDTEASDTISLTAQWDNAKAGNSISIYQGYKELKKSG